jgi:endonuclease YncB( thermonuclease family)
VKDKDRYQRFVAECFVDKESLSKFMVREGYAVAYTQYSSDFLEDEKYAKENNNGIWSMHFQIPSEYRRSLRMK